MQAGSKIIFVFILALMSSCSSRLIYKLGLNADGDDIINTDNVRKKLQTYIDGLQIESAEAYFSELQNSKRIWCNVYYKTGKCKSKSELPPKNLSKILDRGRKCVDAARTCNSYKSSQQELTTGIEDMEKYCRLSNNSYSGHPYPHTMILERARKKLGIYR